KMEEAGKADTALAAQDAASASKEVAKKEEPKKEEGKKAAPMKEEAKKPETKKDEKAAAPAEAMKPDPNTDALTKIHQSGWEAWRDKDSNKLRDITASSLSFVSADGKWYGTKDEVINAWVSMDCKDVKNVKVADGFASPLSPTMEI